MSLPTVYLMYHELRVPERPLCDEAEGYARYCVSVADFRAQLERISGLGYGGWSVSQALRRDRAEPGGVAITFDDGAETDLLTAAPLLTELGFGATFFVVSGWVGRKGFLSGAQLRELRGEGFEIGAHSRTHAFLPDLPRERLQAEIGRAKEELEQWLGSAVEHFSCPGGRWSPAVAAAAREAGFQSVSTSRIGSNARDADPFRLSRIAIMHGTGMRNFERLCRGEGLWLRQTQDELLRGAKRVLGNSVYQAARSVLLLTERVIR